MSKTIPHKKREKAMEDLRAIVKRVYADDNVSRGQVFKVMRDHYRTIMLALEAYKPPRSREPCGCKNGACSRCYDGPVIDLRKAG